MLEAAELEIIGDEGELRLITQQSRSFDPGGQALGVLRIDHVAAEGSCTRPNQGGTGRHQDAQGWLDRPASATKIYRGLMLICALLALGGLFAGGPGEIAIQHFPFFYGIFGLSPSYLSFLPASHCANS